LLGALVCFAGEGVACLGFFAAGGFARAVSGLVVLCATRVADFDGTGFTAAIALAALRFGEGASVALVGFDFTAANGAAAAFAFTAANGVDAAFDFDGRPTIAAWALLALDFVEAGAVLELLRGGVLAFGTNRSAGFEALATAAGFRALEISLLSDVIFTARASLHQSCPTRGLYTSLTKTKAPKATLSAEW
jgi:hypothetical protein